MGDKKSVFLQDVEEMLMELNVALKGFQLYPRGHSALRNITSKVSNLLINLLKESDLNISLIGQDLVINGIPFLRASGAIESFKQEMRKRKIEGISFLGGLEEEELKDFIESFLSKDWREEIEKRKINHIKIGKISVGLQPTAKEVTSEEQTSTEQTFQRYQGHIDKAREITEGVIRTRALESEKVNSTVEDILEALLKDKSAFLNLNRIKSYDNYTFTHCVDTCMLSLIQGEALNFSKDKLLELGVSAFLHDLGKISIPERVLNRPSKLTSAEYAIIQEHPIKGAKLLQETKGITPLAAVVAFEHHIYYNLEGGYPKLKQKRRLNLFTMIVAIADVYDALTTLRPYRKPLLPYQALKTISQLAGTQFEPFLVRNFVRLLGPYPIGSFVRLNTNELGFIWKLNPGRLPWVKIIFDAEGRKLEDFLIVDLSSQRPDQRERKIVSYDNPLFKGITPEEIMSPR
ncbi:MAG: HD domain-containing protein [Candidatus Omnitrophica bacterium]|nr:HD domain-containing protein [Candidatus Omnitrophota bacterium]